MVRMRIGAALVALGVTLLSGCTNSSTTPNGGGSTTGTGATGTTGTTGTTTVTLSEPDRNRTVTVAVGGQVTVTLHSTYWQFADPEPSSVLTPLSDDPKVVASRDGCVPGQGCGTVSMSFRAAKTGTATVSASRTSCGEAMACVGDQGSYQLTVVVQ